MCTSHRRAWITLSLTSGEEREKGREEEKRGPSTLRAPGGLKHLFLLVIFALFSVLFSIFYSEEHSRHVRETTEAKTFQLERKDAKTAAPKPPLLPSRVQSQRRPEATRAERIKMSFKAATTKPILR